MSNSETSVIIQSKNGVIVKCPRLAHEPQLCLLRGYFEGVCFESVLEAKHYDYVTKKRPSEYIVECLRQGKSIDGIKSYWRSRLTLYKNLYNQLLEEHPLDYVGKDQSVLIGDIVKDCVENNVSGFTDGAWDYDKWIHSWNTGVGCLLILKEIADDEQNGFGYSIGPESLIDVYSDEVAKRGEAERTELAARSEPSMP